MGWVPMLLRSNRLTAACENCYISKMRAADAGPGAPWMKLTARPSAHDDARGGSGNHGLTRNQCRRRAVDKGTAAARARHCLALQLSTHDTPRTVNALLDLLQFLGPSSARFQAVIHSLSVCFMPKSSLSRLSKSGIWAAP